MCRGGGRVRSGGGREAVDVHTRRCMSNRQREALSHTAWRRGEGLAGLSGYSWSKPHPFNPPTAPLGLPPSGSCRRIPSGSYVDTLHKHGSRIQLLLGEYLRKNKNCCHNADVRLFVCRFVCLFSFSSLLFFPIHCVHL